MSAPRRPGDLEIVRVIRGPIPLERPADEHDDRGPEPVEYTETRKGRKARHDWARRYDELNGAPEDEGDR